jgi:hypothetical protein
MWMGAGWEDSSDKSSTADDWGGLFVGEVVVKRAERVDDEGLEGEGRAIVDE